MLRHIKTEGDRHEECQYDSNGGKKTKSACIVTFSYVIEQFVLENYDCMQIGQCYSATGITPIYGLKYNGKNFAFFKTYVGAPACVATIEDTFSQIKTDKYIVFGGCGCLDREITRGKVMIPTEAYRDEGTSYHYAPASDYITISNANTVRHFMEENKIPHVMGKTWTTDAIYRETVRNMMRDISISHLRSPIMCRSTDFYQLYKMTQL